MKASKYSFELENSVGKFFDLETSDGVVREGKITGLTIRNMIFNGIKVDIPIEIEINGDPNDRIPLIRIAKLNVRN